MINFGELLNGIPEGDWVAISDDETRVLAHGPDLQTVRAATPDSDDALIIRNCKLKGFLTLAQSGHPSGMAAVL